MKTGYHAIYAENYFDGISAARDNGFDFVQFDLGVPKFFLDNLSVNKLNQIRDFAVDKNIEITFHAPGDNVSLFCDYPLIREGIRDQFKLILEKANILNARHITIHAGHYPEFKKSGQLVDDYYSDYYEEVLYDNLKCITKDSGNVLVCLENFHLNKHKISVAQKMIDDKNPLYLTLDSAKLYTADYSIHQEVHVFMKDYKNFIRELHVHDLNKQFGSHQVVGTGVVDFDFLFREFYNDNVYVNFEVRPVEAARDSKNNLLEILHVS